MIRRNRKRPYRADYNLDEILALVQEYDELRYLRHKSFVSVRLMDLEKALVELGPKEYQAVLLCGLIGLTARTAGEHFGVSASTMNNRYRHGLESLARYLNGVPIE